MAAYVYYLILAAIGLAVTVFVFHKEKNYYKLIVFFLFAAMFADCGEVVVLLIFNGYAYSLGIFSNFYAENILAHLIMNNTLWPAVAVFVAAYSPRFRSIITISIIFFALDILFIQLGVYQHNWWRSWMSGAAVFLFLIIMRFWYAKLEDEKFKIMRYLTYSFIFSLIMFMPTSILILTDKAFYHARIFADIYKDSVFFSFLFHSSIALLCTSFLCVLEKWYWKLIPFLLFLISDYLLMALGILNFAYGWNILYLVIIRTLSLIIFIWLEHKYSYNPK